MVMDRIRDKDKTSSLPGFPKSFTYLQAYAVLLDLKEVYKDLFYINSVYSSVAAIQK